MNTKNKETEHDEIENLLPWHAAGTLGRRDTQRVEEALANDPELARRFEMVREELGETILLNETLGAPSGRAMEKLFAKIDAEPARKQAMSFGILLEPVAAHAGLCRQRSGARYFAAGGNYRHRDDERDENIRLRDRLRADHRSWRGRFHAHPFCASGVFR